MRTVNKIKIITFILIFIFSILLAEILSLIAYSYFHIAINGKTFNDFSSIMKSHYTKVYSANSTEATTAYDPLTQIQFHNKAYISPFEINSYGYLSNGNEDNNLNTFPEKQKGVFRVIMLGGSSLFGTGVSHANKTIPSLLEKYANVELKNINTQFKFIQVLNFGHPGAHTSIELAKLSQYLVHLEPDLVISLDGFNDSWYALFEHKRSGGMLEQSIINWADYSLLYFRCLNFNCKNENNNFGLISYLLPTSSSLINSLIKYSEQKKIKSYIKSYPPYKISKFINLRDGGKHNALLMNYAASAGLSCSQNFSFVGILQPHAFESTNFLTKSELLKLQKWENIYGSYTGGSSNYKKEMHNIYNLYEEGIINLKEAFNSCKKVDFYSFRELLNLKRNLDYYVDNIHYTENGNKKIAHKILPILINHLKK